MPAFQTVLKGTPASALPKRPRVRIPYQWSFVARLIVGFNIAGFTFGFVVVRYGGTLTIFGIPNIVFVLLPVLVSFASAQFQGYDLGVFFRATPLYLLLTFCLIFVYYTIIAIANVLIFEQVMNVAGVTILIPIASSLAWSIMLGPLRLYLQRIIERRFNVHNREEARFIEDFTATLRQEIDLDQLCDRFLTVIQQTLHPFWASLWIRIREPQRELPNPFSSHVVIAEDDPLLAYMLEHAHILEIDRLALKSPALRLISNQAAELLLPLTSQGELLGLLLLGPHLKGQMYTPRERSLLASLIPQVAPALQVAQMVRERQAQIREHERIEQELLTARTIQQSLLPARLPDLPGWQLAAYYQPAREVGGDFYDFLSFGEDRLGLIIGDVSGKGIPAALLMSSTLSLLRAAAQVTDSPGKVLARVNELLCADMPPGTFVTCFYAILDLSSGRLRYANAGHDLPYGCSGEAVHEFTATGMPLGLLPGTHYEEREALISAGEHILFYSDGLVEAHNPDREMFGFPRLKQVMAASASARSGADLITLLRQELTCFTGENWEQEDDVTLVVLQRSAGFSADS
jgi:serine phosphatase RsbU (regulator of sigma subunit)